MIGQLRGTLLHKQPPHLLLDVHGVGYEVEAPMSTFYVLPAVGNEVLLYTHLIVREDAHILFGFATPTERALFRDLIKVNGVGAKLAVTILSGISVDGFIQCVHSRDTATLTRLPGIGKKTAERLVMEMKDRLGDRQGGAAAAALAHPDVGMVDPGSPLADAVSALIALGYKPHEASRMVRGIDTAGLPSEEIIRRALQAVAKA
ncbi:MAG: Holliday junction branch migration protein RuvA [Gammaproteobacteria bacterium]